MQQPATLYSPWGPQALPANDNRPLPRTRNLMIGLTGKRNVGKSTVANMLEEEFGFERIHAFDAGKEAAVAWFYAIGGDGDAMVYGDLKDVPSHLLPGEVAPRFFLEKFGHFMGAVMGVEWTLGLEIARARARNPRAPIVVESLVYEAPWFKSQGGTVWRLERPGHEGPAGVESDAVQALIAADVCLSANSVDELLDKARGALEQVVGGG
jgi:hypothetical protein